jgi:N-acetylmuramoyl-L-alanine amidase
MLEILIQQGHVAPREPGFEAATGTPGEQELVIRIADALAGLLAVDGRFAPVVVPGDIPDGIAVDAALFLHADGSPDPTASGYSFGYPDHDVNRRLAELLATQFDLLPGHPTHRRDNLTADLRRYYGFARVATLGPEALVEHGFLTNPGERLWLFANVSELAGAEYRALCSHFGLRPTADRPRKPWPVPLPAWVWPWMAWRLAGAPPGERPASAPRLIPLWAWARLQALIRARSEGGT